MRVLLIGSSQKKQIMELYTAAGHRTKIREWGGTKQMIKLVADVLWCDTVYIVYGRDYATYRIVRLAAALKRKIIIHWIGSDVLQATESYAASRSVWNAGFRHVDLACAPHLVDELAQIGISAAYVPILSVNHCCEAVPMPPSHAILTYIPEAREQFYGMDVVKHLAEKYPKIPFYIAGNSGKNDTNKRHNIHYQGMLGWEELKALYGKCSTLLRCTEHDGLPVMILEAMQHGRQVIYNFEFPYAYTPENRDIESIEKLFAAVTASPPSLNLAGMKYVNDTFTEEQLKRKYQEIGII